MSRLNISKRNGLLASTALLLVLMLACSTDSPTAPTQEPSIPSGAANNWVITITIDPEVLEPDSADPAEIRVKIESRDTPGAYPPPGASIVITTSLGELGSSGSEATSVAGFLDNRGRAQEFLFPTGFAGSGTVAAQHEGSVGRQSFRFKEPKDRTPFITGVSPSSGPIEGGTVVTISGQDFSEPLVVTFEVEGEALPAEVLRVKSGSIRVRTPGFPDDSTDCLATIDVEFADTDTQGDDAEFLNGFTYTGGACGT